MLYVEKIYRSYMYIHIYMYPYKAFVYICMPWNGNQRQSHVWIHTWWPMFYMITGSGYHWRTWAHTATHCNTLQHTKAHCNTLLHTAARCNILQHTESGCHKRTRRVSVLSVCVSVFTVCVAVLTVCVSQCFSVCIGTSWTRCMINTYRRSILVTRIKKQSLK